MQTFKTNNEQNKTIDNNQNISFLIKENEKYKNKVSLDFINEQSIKSKNEQTKINEDNKNISLLIKEN